MTSYESIYDGATNLSPSYYSPPISSYQSSVDYLGIAMDPRTANQLGELNLRLNPGVKTIEVQGTFANILESIPEQHLDEMRRISELTGTHLTLHGPLLNASGVEQQGGWSEENRIGVENQMKSAILRAHKLDPKGNIPVTFHSTANLPEFQPHIMEKGKRIQQGLWFVDEDTGQLRMLRPERRYLGEEKGEFTGEIIKFEAEKELARRNEDSWTQSISNVNHYANYGDELITRAKRILPSDAYKNIGKIDISKIKDESDRALFAQGQREISSAQIYLWDSYRNLKTFFDKAWAANKESGNEQDRKNLKDFAEFAKTRISRDIGRDPEKLEDLKEVVERGLKTLQNLNEIPKLVRPLNDFVIKKSAETFANVAESAYSKYGNTSPILSIENPPGGEGLSTGEDLKKLVLASREQLAKNLSEKGISKGQAKAVAERMIGATWDVGHINMMRKKGYSEKDVIAETKKIAPFVKHVHLSDNFGLDHTELPMGMGNVPLKPMIEEIKKAGFKGKEIIEAGNWWRYFAEKGGGNPFLPSIELMDSPIYQAMYGPTWSQMGRYGAYFSGHGPVNTPIHHNLYGAGFQNLPVELGGEIPGDRGRFAGTPNQ